MIAHCKSNNCGFHFRHVSHHTIIFSVSVASQTLCGYIIYFSVKSYHVPSSEIFGNKTYRGTCEMMVSTQILPHLVMSMVIFIPVLSEQLCLDGRCFQKCCPKGMYLHKKSHRCRNVPGNLSNFSSSPLHETRNIRNYNDDESDSKCSDEMFQSKFDHFDECFSILPNGSMVRFNQIEKNSTIFTDDLYCIDHESNDDGSLVRLPLDTF